MFADRGLSGTRRVPQGRDSPCRWHRCMRCEVGDRSPAANSRSSLSLSRRCSRSRPRRTANASRPTITATEVGRDVTFIGRVIPPDARRRHQRKPKASQPEENKVTKVVDASRPALGWGAVGGS